MKFAAFLQLLGGVGFAVAMLASCAQRTDTTPAAAPAPAPTAAAAVAPATAPSAPPALPNAKPVARMFGRTNLVRYYDADTGVVCYAQDDVRTSPSCLKVGSMAKVPSDL